MKIVIWQDKNGYKHGSLLRDLDSSDAPEIGIPLDPPDVREIFSECEKEVHNALVDRNLFTWEDVQWSQDGVTSVITSIVRRRFIERYKEKHINQGVRDGK